MPAGDLQYRYFGEDILLNDTGDVLYKAWLADIGTTDHTTTGWYRYRPSGVREVLRGGDLSPDGNGTFSVYESPTLDDAGHVAVTADLVGTVGGFQVDHVATYLSTDAGLSTILHYGDPSPSGVGTVGWLFRSLSINAHGHVLLQDGKNKYLYDGQQAQVLISDDAGVPGGGETFEAFHPSTRMNNAGQVLIAAGFESDPFSGTLDDVFYIYEDGTLNEIVRRGDPLPGGVGVFPRLSGVAGLHKKFINGRGQVAFMAEHAYRFDGPEIVELMKIGDVPPDGNGTFGRLDLEGLNNAGVALIDAYQIYGSANPDRDDEGLYLTDGIDTLKVVREEEELNLIDINDYDTASYPGGSEDGRARALNDYGQVVFRGVKNPTSSSPSEGIFLYTPDLVWRSGEPAGGWDAAANWTLSTLPAHVHDVTVAPDVDVVIAGPSSDAHVNSLDIGGGAGNIDLTMLLGATLEAVGDITIVGQETDLALRVTGGLTAGVYTIFQSREGGISGTFNLISDLGVYDDLVGIVYEADRITVTLDRDILVGDLNLDGLVGITDLNIVLANWNQNVPAGDPLADPNGDGFVGIDDLNTVLGNWNAGAPPTSTANIPEPSMAGLMVVCFVVVNRRVRCGG